MPQEAKLHNGSPEVSPGLTVGQIFGMLAKGKWYIAASTLLFFLAALAYVLFAKPVYEATATIRIDQSRASSLGISDLVSGNLPGSSDALATEIEVMQSDAVAIAALDSLPDDVFERFTGAEKKDLLIPTGKESLTVDQEDAIEAFKNQLAVKQLPDTELVAISFQSNDPRLAATVVNHTVTAYLRLNFDSHYGSVTQVNAWLSSQLQALQQRAAEAQKNLANFQEKNGIVDTDAGPTSGANTTTDLLRLLNSRLAEAEADRITKQAQLQAATAAGSNPAVLGSLFADPGLNALQATRATLYGQYAQLASKFGPRYSPLVQLKQQIDAIDAEISRNDKALQSRLQQDYNAAKSTEDMLRSEYETQTRKAYALNRQQGELAVLQSDVTSSREIYNTLQLKLQQAGINAGLSGVNTLPIDMARVPTYPIKPKKLVIIAVGTALGLLIGIVAVFIVEASGDKVQDLAQLGAITGYRTLASIPRSKRTKNKDGLQDPDSVEVEAYRKLRSLLMYSSRTDTLRLLLITSADPHEGKSTVCANLAGVIAQTGVRVLLVDADLRRPRLNGIFGVTNSTGLSEALAEPSVPAAIQQPVPTLPNLFLLTAGEHSSLPAELLASVKCQDLLNQWRSSYDYVVLQSPPLLSVSDGLPLAQWVDGTILVAREQVTRLKRIQAVREMLKGTDANVVGVVLTDAKLKGVVGERY